jgi:hypothetical protein
VSNGIAATCEQLGGPLVYVNLKDSTGKLLYPENNGAGHAVPCKNADGLQGTLFPYLYGGNYTVYVQAVGPGNALYSSNQTPGSAPVAAVIAGTFPVLDGNTFAINVTNP